MTESEFNLRQMSKLLVGVWLLAGLSMLTFVAFALVWMAPLEMVEVILISAFAAIFAAVPLALAWATSRVKTWVGIGWSVTGLMVWSASFSWMVTNG